MVFLNLKTFLFTFIVFYSTYLYNYKCPTLTPLESIENKVLHPLTSQHSTLCELLHGGLNKIDPYYVQLNLFLDKNIRSQPIVKEWGLCAKVEKTKSNLKYHVYPLLNQLYEFTDYAETRIYDELNHYYLKAEEFVHGKLKQD
ncbi:uncharacterized protein KGF55_003400 [Candida pseudojiufengensis]|uniref:uncharacterized protein n=1 Tax=Candida pseudojiufengensis TaxID=497109 RepID=UPI0022244C4F|nr:uncharacterized protein KGF55_003400 [Candida pseudojiufengensis]KAI5962324.1 hypothetical protein KGF55_003400 [Candida pseudojiufengensis]